MIRHCFLILMTCLFTHSAVALTPPPVTAKLLSTHRAVKPGQTFHILLEMEIAPKWHIYWENPGDSGLPVSIDWAGSSKFLTFGPLQFPIPERYEVAGLVNFVHHHKAYFLTAVTLSPESPISAEKLKIQADIHWLMCQESCVPDSTKQTLSLTVTDQPVANPKTLALKEDFIQNRPKSAQNTPFLSKFLENKLTIRVEAPQLNLTAPITAIDFFPLDMPEATFEKPTTFDLSADQLQIILNVMSEPERVHGILQLQTASGMKAFIINQEIEKEK